MTSALTPGSLFLPCPLDSYLVVSKVTLSSTSPLERPSSSRGAVPVRFTLGLKVSLAYHNYWKALHNKLNWSHVFFFISNCIFGL